MQLNGSAASQSDLTPASRRSLPPSLPALDAETEIAAPLPPPAVIEADPGIDDDLLEPMSEPRFLERHVRLSQSLVWTLQRAFFEREGPRAFTRRAAPAVTSSPLVARAHAAVVHGWLRDMQARADHDPERPAYIVEIGAGSGCFAHAFLRELLSSVRGTALEDTRFVYVLTDLAERNIEALRVHPGLQPFVSSGHMDFARFDAQSDRGLTLLGSGHVLCPETAEGSLAVIANHVFDSLPQDAFCVENGQLHESLVTLLSSGPEPRRDDPSLLSRVDLVYTHRPLLDEPYGDPDFNRILLAQVDGLSDARVLFPCAALGCIERLLDLSGGDLLLLASDKACPGGEPASNRSLPGIAVHGSISMPVDYQALARFFLDRGGHPLRPARQPHHLELAAFLAGSGAFPETQRAFAEAVDRWGPDDFFTMKTATERHLEAMTLEELLAWTRMSGHDVRVFLSALPAIAEALPSAGADALEELHRAVLEVWDLYFSIGEARDVAFHLGCLLTEMGHYSEAVGFHQWSLHCHGPTAQTIYSMGICYYRMGRLEEALLCIEEALLLDPGLGEARATRARVAGEVGRQRR